VAALLLVVTTIVTILPQVSAAAASSVACDGDTCTAPVLKIGVIGAGTSIN
jgi:hypothetical protein